MAIIFGTRERGVIKTYKKQFITTEVEYAIIPLKLGNTILTTFKKDKILIIKRNNLSIAISILRGVYNIFLGFSILLFLSLLINGEHNIKSISFFLVTLLLFVYINFFLGKSTKNENKIRELIFKETGYAVLPEWIDINDYRTKMIYENLKLKYTEKFTNRKYTETNVHINDLNFPIFFSYISFENVFNPNTKTNEIYNKLIEKLI